MESDEAPVGEQEAADIRAQVTRVLRDLGDPDPSLILSDVMELLKLDFHYYSSTDLSVFDELAHKIKVAGKLIIREPGRILDVIKKARLNALWLPNGRRILMDEAVPTPKQRHVQAHEITHSVTPWHRTFLLGDNELTLDPQCQAIIEVEANYGAGQLLFLMDRFAADARDATLDWTSLTMLRKRYQNTLTTTLWHAIEEREPDHPVVGLIGRHPRHPTIGCTSEGGDIRHFIRSRGFRLGFANVNATEIYRIIRSYIGFSKRGPCGSATRPLVDANGDQWEFGFQSFCNTYDLLTFGVSIRRRPFVSVVRTHAALHE
jgi:hypothetical protein